MKFFTMEWYEEMQFSGSLGTLDIDIEELERYARREGIDLKSLLPGPMDDSEKRK